MKNEIQYLPDLLFPKRNLWIGTFHEISLATILIFLLFPIKLKAQEFTAIRGFVSSEKGEALSGVTIRINKISTIGQSNKDGYFTINKVPIGADLIFSRLGYKDFSLLLSLDSSTENSFNIVLKPDIQSLDEIFITEKFKSYSLNNLNFKKFSAFPQTTGSFESFIKSLPGVIGNNELSSQYSVRGGNFDENLIYLNNVEIYRPLLIRSGQQEGLGFINPSLTSNVYFSAGGFEARYGDKLSSVLDVGYTKPDSLSIETQIGLLLNTVTLKFPLKNGFLLAGFRNKNNQNLLERQNIDGDYQSRYSDYQILLKQSITPKINFSFFTLYNLGKLKVDPNTRTTEFGTSDDVLRLFVDYSGQESSSYKALNSAITFSYNPNNTLNIKWISSVASINENEDSNLLGWYSFIDRGSRGLGTFNNYGLLGAGSNQTFYKNELQSTFYNSELKVFKQLKKSFFEMGARYQLDSMNDDLNEFNAIDTSAYSYPESGNWIYSGLINETNKVKINRLTAYIQNTLSLGSQYTLVSGMRVNYNNYSKESLLSPRLSLMYSPNQNDQLLVKFAIGSYIQAPFYREIKNYNGSINLSARAQKSLNFITGVDYFFSGLGTRLKFSSEVYYKHLSRITPYKIEDLKIRYLSEKTSKGYAIGTDLSLSGNFAKNLESTFRISIMKTEEDIVDDFYFSKDKFGNSLSFNPGYLRRPSDQLLNVGIMFQDRLIQNPTYKVHLNIIYSSNLPIGPPGPQRYTDQFKVPSYKRVDIGFSKDFADADSRKGSIFIKKNFQTLSLHAELFNLLNFKNTASYIWLNDKSANQYAVPNYLSSRIFNLRLIAIIKSR